MNRSSALLSVAVIAVCSQLGSEAFAQSPDDALALFGLDGGQDGYVRFEASDQRGRTHTFTGVSLDEDDEVRADEIRLVNPRVIDGAATFDSLEVLGFSAENGGDDVMLSMDRLVIEDPSPQLAAVVASALTNEDFDDVDWGVFTDYAFSGIEVEGLTVNAEDEVLATLGSLRLGDFENSRLGALAFNAFAVSGPLDDGGTGSISLGSWTMNGLDLEGLDALFDAEGGDADDLQRALAASGLNDPFRQRYDDYAFNDFAADFDGVLVSLASMEGTSRERRGVLETSDQLRGLLVEFSADSKGSAGAQALAAVGMLGYDSLEFNGDFEVRADREADRVYTDGYRLTMTDGFTLDLDYDLEGVDAYTKNAVKQSLSTTIDFDPEAMTSLLAPLVLNGFEMRLTDESLVERSFAAMAESQGTSPEIARSQAIGFLALGAMFAPPGAEAVTSDAIAALTSFLQDPGTLRVAIAPDAPVSVAELITATENEDFSGVVDLLGVEIEAE